MNILQYYSVTHTLWTGVPDADEHRQYSQTDNKRMQAKYDLQNAAVNPRTLLYKQYGWIIVAPDASHFRLVPPSMRRQSGCCR